MLCRACGSYRHLVADCEHSWEKNASVNVTDSCDSGKSHPKYEEENDCCFVREAPEELIFLSKLNKNESQILSKEARKCAILDSACTSTVCGENWMLDYLGSLSPQDLDKVKRRDSEKIFKFGGGEKLKSVGKFTIP